MTIVAVSGYFDPLHIGHLEYFKLARALGDKLIVILNNDEQTKLKKSKSFMPVQERKVILESLSNIDEVVISIDSDGSVCKSLEKIKPDIFAKGGDRFGYEIPEAEICNKLDIKIVDGLGEKIQSSSELVRVSENNKGSNVKEVPKVWGKEIWMANTDLYCGKKLILDQGKRCSIHYHKNKDETFYIDKGKVLMEVDGKAKIMKEGESVLIKSNVKHRFSGIEDSLIIEISTNHEDSDSYREEGQLSGDVPREIMGKYS